MRVKQDISHLRLNASFWSTCSLERVLGSIGLFRVSARGETCSARLIAGGWYLEIVSSRSCRFSVPGREGEEGRSLIRQVRFL